MAEKKHQQAKERGSINRTEVPKDSSKADEHSEFDSQDAVIRAQSHAMPKLVKLLNAAGVPFDILLQSGLDLRNPLGLGAPEEADAVRLEASIEQKVFNDM